MMGIFAKQVDSRPTMAEWPVKIWAPDEIPAFFRTQVFSWARGNLDGRHFVYAPERRANQRSFPYLFGYGEDEILYLKKEDGEVTEITLHRGQILEVRTTRELLEAELTIVYGDPEGQQKSLSLSYVPSVYYLYDPFLNWLLGLDREFVPALAERAHPRPQRLYQESLPMFNYSLGAYRLGTRFSDYIYRFQPHRHKWMPWRKFLEEWLEISMERGTFHLHTLGYLTQCRYRLDKFDQTKS